MGAIIDPFARCGDPFAGRDHRRMPTRRDELAVAARLDPQNAETVLLNVVRDALDEARQHFLGGWFRLRLHVDCCVIYFASSVFVGVSQNHRTRRLIKDARGTFLVGR
jgi:hypothetical protein